MSLSDGGITGVAMVLGTPQKANEQAMNAGRHGNSGRFRSNPLRDKRRDGTPSNLAGRNFNFGRLLVSSRMIYRHGSKIHRNRLFFVVAL